jgi:hypothetical protein
MDERKKIEKGRTRREREAFKEHVNKLLESAGHEKIELQDFYLPKK